MSYDTLLTVVSSRDQRFHSIGKRGLLVTIQKGRTGVTRNSRSLGVLRLRENPACSREPKKVTTSPLLNKPSLQGKKPRTHTHTGTERERKRTKAKDREGSCFVAVLTYSDRSLRRSDTGSENREGRVTRTTTTPPPPRLPPNLPPPYYGRLGLGRHHGRRDIARDRQGGRRRGGEGESKN